jgi:hypothetical protein
MNMTGVANGVDRTGPKSDKLVSQLRKGRQ